MPPSRLRTRLPSYRHTSTSRALHLPPAAELPRGADTYATTFEQARDLFNAGVPRARKALDFYKLDGWVTAHIEILFDISKAYGCDTRNMQHKFECCVLPGAKETSTCCLPRVLQVARIQYW